MKSTKNKQDKCRKKSKTEYVVLESNESVCLGLKTCIYIAYLWWFPLVWAGTNFLSTKNGFFYSQFHSSNRGLNFSLVLWDTMLRKWPQIMSAGGWMKCCSCLHWHTGTNKSPSTLAAFCWSADFLQYGSCRDTITRENNKKSAKRSVMGIERNTF